MKFVQIKYPDLKLLEQFIADAGSSLKSFRYFQSRSIDVVKNHLCTFLLLDEEKPVAYGHLDSENGIVWLGTAVSEKYVGLGLGVMMVNELLNFAKQNNIKEIKLTVDDDNAAAIKLYEKSGFIYQEKKGTVRFYKLIL